jgi:uncharacterized protein (TIGR03545 family)
VGAKVELADARVRLSAGRLVLRGLQVTNPFHPMQNLVEASEITAALNPLPLLEKKVVVDSLVARNVRFDTPRRTSGALKRSGGAASAVAQRVQAWAGQIRIPSFSLEGLGGAIELPRLNVDSLRTAQHARAIVQFTDSARRGWDAAARSLDPGPKIDSAKALIERLRTLDPRALGVDGARQTIQTTRATLDVLTGTLDRVRTLGRSVDSGVARIRAGVSGLDDARRDDYAYARGLIKLPSLEAPDISPALFGQTALDQLQAILYWVQVAERYVPAGLAARLHDGPKRARMAGTTVAFPRTRAWPQFLLRVGALDLTIGGEGAAGGHYVARLTGLTTEPAIYGQPFRFLAQRSAGRAGLEDVRVAGLLDHVRTPLRDSVEVSLAGFALPTLDLPPVRARAALGAGTTEISLLRRGDEIVARWLIRSTNVAWQRLADSAGARAGAQQEIENLVWRTVSGVRDVEVEAQIRGALAAASLSVRSNLGTELARRLRQEIGAKVERAEQRVRAQVDSLVQNQLAAARQRLTAVQQEVQARLAKQQTELTAVRAELEARLRDLTRKLALPRLPLPR